MQPTKDLLVKRIKEVTGLSLKEFCEKHLHTQYDAFKYRKKHKHYHPNEIIYMCLALNDTAQNLFGKDFLALMLDNGPEDVKNSTVKLITGNKSQLLALLMNGKISKTEHRIPTPEKEKPPVKDQGQKKGGVDHLFVETYAR